MTHQPFSFSHLFVLFASFVVLLYATGTRGLAVNEDRASRCVCEQIRRGYALWLAWHRSMGIRGYIPIRRTPYDRISRITLPSTFVSLR